THDLGVVAETADRVVVMYAGRKVEEATVDELFEAPLHPYTVGLIGATPIPGAERAERLADIPGMVPPLNALPQGCAFAPRCKRVMPRCLGERPELTAPAPGGAGARRATGGKAVMRLVPVARGAVVVDGVDIAPLDGAELTAMRRKVQMI